MLFGTTEGEADTAEDGPVEELRVCALNVNSPNPSRAQRTVNWLLATKSNTLVLTEMQPSDGAATSWPACRRRDSRPRAFPAGKTPDTSWR